MSSYDYYNNKPLPNPRQAPQLAPSPSPYYEQQQDYGASSLRHEPSPPPSYPASYRQTPPLQQQQQQKHQPYRADNSAARPYGSSPFDTVFDDHVYPASSQHTPSASQNYLGEGNTEYRGISRVPSDDMTYSNGPDDIPLQTRPKDVETNDHVYNAPERQKSRKGRVRFGELGMFGANAKRIPWMVYLFTTIQVAVFIGEIVKNSLETGSPIMIHPQFNPMIGPSTYILINMGARFVPCMHNVQGVQSSTIHIDWPCPNTTTSDPLDPTQKCSLSDLCGFGGVPEPLYDGDINQSPQPNQWFRFIVPMFLHAGLVHIGFNLLLQLTMGREMEKAIGSIRFFLVYISSGIFGFVMGGNFAATGISSTGASGSLFGIIALTLLDLLYSWKDRRNPVKDLMFIILDIAISFVLGLLPGLDNFSHIGGFLMGLALGICVLHSPNALRRRIGDDSPYSTVNSSYARSGTTPSFFKNPIGFFKGRKPLWWGWWLLRAGALVLVTVVFILLLNNFYIYHNTCSWCKYLSCLPINNWCELGNLQLTNTTSKRDLMSPLEKMAKLYM